MAALSTSIVKRLMSALADKDAGNTVADALNKADALATQSLVAVVAAIVATDTSQTTDFGALKVGDKVAMIPATAGNADFITVAVAGDLGQAAVVGNLYLVFRTITLPAASTEKF